MERVKYPRTWHLPDSPNRGADGDHACGRHSIGYDRLPSYFQLFAVYDTEARCLGWDDTAAWAQRLGVDLVPLLLSGEVVTNGLASS